MAEKKNVNQMPQQDFVLLAPFPASQQSSMFVKLQGYYNCEFDGS
jgi:hypothetical protein